MITVFANSTFYTPMINADTTGGGSSCLDHLRKRGHGISGIWANGLTVFHVLENVHLFLKERHRKQTVIIHLGAVEAFTHPPANILYWCSHFLLENGCTPHFQAHAVPMMVKASHDLSNNINSFYRIADVGDFASMLEQIILLLEGFSVILIGMNKPNSNNKNVEQRWLSQAALYEEALKMIAGRFNNVLFVEMWDRFSEYVVDTTHLTPAGHTKLYDIINFLLEENYAVHNK
jgi:hypothetical protein